MLTAEVRGGSPRRGVCFVSAKHRGDRQVVRVDTIAVTLLGGGSHLISKVIRLCYAGMAAVGAPRVFRQCQTRNAVRLRPTSS